MAVDDVYTKSLLHFNGSNGSTTFTDESGKTWTASGDAKISTAQSVFGGSSGLFDGTGDYISTSDSDDFYLGANDFAFDFRFRTASITTTQAIAGQYQDANNNSRIQLYYDSGTSKFQLAFQIYDGGSSVAAAYRDIAINVNEWHHAAIVRYGDILTWYLDGVKLGNSLNLSGLSIKNLSSSFYIGYRGSGGTFNGYLDEFRFTLGSPRWTENFTPPNTPYGPTTRLKEIANLSEFGMI